MTVAIHGFLNATAGAQDGTQISEGTGLSSMVRDVAINSESDPISFGIRLVNPITVIPLNLTANDTADYAVSTSGIQYSNTDAWNAFDGSLTTYWMSSALTGWLKLHKKVGNLIVCGYTFVGSTMGIGRSPQAWTITDFGGTVIDSKSSQPTWSDNEKRTFMLASPVTVNELIFNLSHSSDKVAIKEIELLTVDTLPTASCVTVSAEGVNADKWSLSRDGVSWQSYGAPLTINEALTVNNMILYAKCKSVSTDTLGKDTSVKIKIAAE